VITRRRLGVALAVAGLVALVLLTPRTEDPDSTLALRRFLENLGLDVSEREGLPSAGGTLVLIGDLRGPDEAQPILDWARAGGDLVVADPASVIVGMVGASASQTLGFGGTLELTPSCVAPAVVGVDRIVARATDIVLVAQDPALLSCFPIGDGALVLTRAYGEGRVTLLGGASAFTNALLREADNAVLASGVAGSGPEVVFGPPTSAVPGSTGIWDALPDAARAAVMAIVAAVVAFALVRARRLGRPLIEEPIAPIPGSELVRAAGRMYRKARAAAYAGTLMRQAAVSRMARRFGAAGAHDLSGAVARTSGLPRDRIEEILEGREPRDDDELMALGADLERLSAEAEMGGR
jgi:hypothetical protein